MLPAPWQYIVFAEDLHPILDYFGTSRQWNHSKVKTWTLHTKLLLLGLQRHLVWQTLCQSACSIWQRSTGLRWPVNELALVQFSKVFAYEIPEYYQDQICLLQYCLVYEFLEFSGTCLISRNVSTSSIAASMPLIVIFGMTARGTLAVRPLCYAIPILSVWLTCDLWSHL